eukprot:scaffold141453_cov139-Phaeocystis_antarctica.AAC.1
MWCFHVCLRDARHAAHSARRSARAACAAAASASQTGTSSRSRRGGWPTRLFRDQLWVADAGSWQIADRYYTAS